jgi:hypothetical protein
MPSNKDRVSIALYARGGRPNTYHWALIVGPKQETSNTKGFRHDAKQDIGCTQWYYNVQNITTTAAQMLLVRVTFAKVEDTAQLNRTLAAVPIVQNDPSWTCRIWVKNAIAALEADGKSLGTKVTDWETLENSAQDYVRTKIDAGRFSGPGDWDPQFAPTYDLMNGMEIIP